MKELWQPLTNYCRDVKMFSVVRSVILPRRECVCVCVWFLLVFVPPPDVSRHPHTFLLEREQCWRSGHTPAWLLLHTLSSLPSLLLHYWRTQSDPLALVLLMDCAATSSHDGALLCCPGPGSSREIEWLYVKVKSSRLGGKRKNTVTWELGKVTIL